MAKVTENAALKLLRALKAETEREPSVVLCRTVKEVGMEIFTSQSEIDLAMHFLTSRNLVDTIRRKDGLVAQTNAVSLAWIAEREKSKRTEDTRQMVSTTIAVILGAALAAGLYWAYKRF